MSMLARYFAAQQKVRELEQRVSHLEGLIPHLVDLTWGFAYEDESVPESRLIVKLITQAEERLKKEGPSSGWKGLSWDPGPSVVGPEDCPCDHPICKAYYAGKGPPLVEWIDEENGKVRRRVVCERKAE